MKPKRRIEKALKLIGRYGSIDGLHHKQWVLDQVVRILTDCPTIEIVAIDCRGDEYIYDGPGESIEYKAWVAMRTSDWNIGIAP